MVPPQASRDRASPLPPSPPARRGFAAADASGQTFPAGRGGRGWKEGGLTSTLSPGCLRGLSSSSFSSSLGANKGEPRADAAEHLSPPERAPRAFRASEADARRGGLRIHGRSPGATWPVQVGACVRGAGKGRRSAVSSPWRTAAAAPPCRRRFPCLRGIFFLPAPQLAEARLPSDSERCCFCVQGGWVAGWVAGWVGAGPTEKHSPLARIRGSPLAERRASPTASPEAGAEMSS